MPTIQIDKIMSCSSEDKNHPVQNIISTNSKTWKCKDPGEKQVSVVIQLEQEASITSIDIGNDNSAFIEVLVGKSSTPDVDFQVLLVASSFMSPMEARNSTITNRVRMFTKDMLSKSVADQKWDRVKVVCTQPFNKHIQYGLAFITFHSVMTDDKPAAAVGNKLGRFRLKDEESDDDISTGSLFARRKDSQTSSQEEASPSYKDSAPAVVAKHKPVNVASPSATSSKQTGRAASPVAKATDKPVQKKKSPAKDVSLKNGAQKDRGKKKEKENTKPKKQDGPVAKKPKLVGKPFDKLLENVVVVISGYQNPHRGNLRAMALEMGARYKGDWDNSCTHLVCAFPNTPKFNQVWGKGHIVRKEWIEECHSKRKKLPWRRFALDKRDKSKPESEDEIPELIEDAPPSPVPSPALQDSDVDDGPQSGSDTEDEIERVRAGDPYAGDTDEDTDVDLPNTDAMPLPDLPTFFVDKYFHLHKDLSPDVRRNLQRYILAFKGSLLDKMDDSRIDFVIADKKVDSKHKVVKPDWIWECNDAEKLLPTKSHELQ